MTTIVEHYEEPGKPLTVHWYLQAQEITRSHITLKISGDNTGIGEIGRSVGILIRHHSGPISREAKFSDEIPDGYINDLQNRD